MTTDKQKDLRDYINLYIGCSVVLDHGTSTESIEKMTGVLMSQFIVEDQQLFAQVEMKTIMSISHRNHPVNRLKLVLRPLSSMTEEEAKELIGPLLDLKILMIVGGGISYSTIETDGEPETLFFRALDPVRFKWMLSKGFDIFDLIPAGLAIEQKQKDL